jgi:hypothetical protein
VDLEARPLALAKAIACDADHGGRAGFAGAAVLTIACDADHGGRAGFAGAAVLTIACDADQGRAGFCRRGRPTHCLGCRRKLPFRSR